MKTDKKFINCSWGKTHIVELNKSSKIPVICIHGWLDNWASFQPLSENLSEYLICIDLPGHGHSSHLQEGNWYHFVDYAVRLREVLNHLNLEKFHIAGHSMGAAIGCLYAAVFPESVLSLTMIDGLGPLVNPPEEARNILRDSILHREAKKNKKRAFKDLDLAVKARMSNGEINYESARLLVENQVNRSSGLYTWSFDYKLKFTSSLRLTSEQLLSFFIKLECPVLLIQATEGYVHKAPFWELKSKIRNLTLEQLEGKHHLHMEKPKETAAVIYRFLSSLNNK